MVTVTFLGGTSLHADHGPLTGAPVQRHRLALLAVLSLSQPRPVSRDKLVAHALLDMSTTAQINDSLKLGSALLGEIGNVGRLHKRHVEQAGFAVLKAPDIPSVLVETAFISNPEEESRLASDDYQDQLSDAIMRGINRYFAQNPPLARSRPL